MKRKSQHKLISGLIVAIFLILIFARDILGIGFPSVLFSAVWILGLLVWNDNESAAYTTVATVCFANSVSITTPIFIYICL